ncbi:endolytic transglycosylase MltG [Halocella sp. SP3-1]|nr:endolytic transglycosylase MltG [Halocella sp. SP3-1]
MVKRAGIIFFLFVILITVVFQISYLMGPVDRNAERFVSLRVKPGTTSRELGEILENLGLIRSKSFYNVVMALTGYDSKLKAGLYDIKPSYNMMEIISLLVEGRIATYKVTIPEGFSVEEIAERLAEVTLYNKETFLQKANLVFNKPYLQESTSNIRYVLEGFLYPDTYVIPREYKPEQIFKLMLEEFERRWWDKLQDSSLASKYSPYEIMIIASLIEEEAKIKEEKPLVSAVIYNRLKKRMPLQIDASIQYSLPARKERVLYSDLQVVSRYNTYRHYGLPPGPICSPGDDSIEAALKPAEKDYLFYFALEDGSHKFSRTYHKHIKLQQELKGN